VSHTKGVAQANKTRTVVEGKREKAVAHIPPGEGARSLWVMGELVTYKLPSQKTGGAYSLFEVSTRPEEGPPPHVQHREDEFFYVMEGEYEFLIEGRAISVGAGSLLYIPKGTLHVHRGVGEELGRMLVSQTPGGLYERFFEEVGNTAVDGDSGTLVFEDQPAMKKIVEVAATYGIEIPTPIAE